MKISFVVNPRILPYHLLLNVRRRRRSTYGVNFCSFYFVALHMLRDDDDVRAQKVTMRGQ